MQLLLLRCVGGWQFVSATLCGGPKTPDVRGVSPSFGEAEWLWLWLFPLLLVDMMLDLRLCVLCCGQTPDLPQVCGARVHETFAADTHTNNFPCLLLSGQERKALVQCARCAALVS